MTSRDPGPPSDRWVSIGGGQQDYFAGRDTEAALVTSTVHVDGAELPIQALIHLGVAIQLPEKTTAGLFGEVSLERSCRAMGLGRQRKDGSCPLTPSGERIWIQAMTGDAVLVARTVGRPGRTAYFRLGQLTDATVELARIFGRTQVTFIAANDYLPDGSWRRRRELASEYRVFGALVSCYEAG